MIYINDIAHPFVQTQSLTDLFLALKMDMAKGVAVALNNKVVSRNEWDKCLVNQNDKLILIKATQGG